jgi:exosortase B
MQALREWNQPRYLPWWLAALGLAALYVPTLLGLFTTIWSTDEQGHGPIVLALSVWLIWREWAKVSDPSTDTPKPLAGWLLFALALLLYMLGRSQRILSAQALSAVFMLPALLLLLRGRKQLASVWFPLFFMLFLVPLPGALVDSITQPLKLAVSSVAADVLYSAGYPIARTGVVLQIGPYQLLVADACAGLHTLFSLEAMGLLYLNVVRHSSWLRNVVLAILIVPISFVANVIRVIALSLITYHWGDAAGQGFLHGFAGMLLFMTALIFIISTDSGLRWIAARMSTREAAHA